MDSGAGQQCNKVVPVWIRKKVKRFFYYWPNWIKSWNIIKTIPIPKLDDPGETTQNQQTTTLKQVTLLKLQLPTHKLQHFESSLVAIITRKHFWQRDDLSPVRRALLPNAYSDARESSQPCKIKPRQHPPSWSVVRHTQCSATSLPLSSCNSERQNLKSISLEFNQFNDSKQKIHLYWILVSSNTKLKLYMLFFLLATLMIWTE